MDQLANLPKVALKFGTKEAAWLKWSKMSVEELQSKTISLKEYNVAIRCDTIVVVDIDNKPENASKSCLDMAFMAERVFALQTIIVKSRSGNPHAYFMVDERMKDWKRSCGLFGFIDLCTGASSLVVCPPSVVGGSQYTIYRDAEIARMPDWLFNLLNGELKKDANMKKMHSPKEFAQLTESEDVVYELLTAAKYVDPVLRSNNYGGYDIVFGYKHTCSITGNNHDHIDGYVFKTADGALLSGCYSHSCKDKYKKLSERKRNTQLDSLFDLAARNGASHYDVALIVQAMVGDTIKYVGGDTWYVWNKSSGRWSFDNESRTLSSAISCQLCQAGIEFYQYVVGKYVADRKLGNSCAEDDKFEDYKKGILTICSRVRDHPYKNCIIRECKALLYDGEFVAALDENTNLLGFNDGVYDFSTSQFRKGLPEERVSMTVGYDFPENVDAKLIETVHNVIADPFDSPEMSQYLLASIASCLDGRRLFQEYYVLTGKGANSKSCIQELVSKTLGDYAKPLDITFWTRAKGNCGDAQPELADKKGVRIIFSNEPSDTDVIQCQKLKEISGNDPIVARKLYGHPITFRPQFGVYILCNDLPQLSKSDFAIERRTRIIPFVHQYRINPLPGQPWSYGELPQQRRVAHGANEATLEGIRRGTQPTVASTTR